MIQSPAGVTTGQRTDATAADTVVDADDAVQSLLDVLQDADCRAILGATSDDALSASELSESCDLPLSTTYRKLELLREAALVEERTRIRHSGKHTSEYVRLVEDVVVSLEDDGATELEVSRRAAATSRMGP